MNLPIGLLTIRDTKFYKTRIAALGPQLQKVLMQYAEDESKKVIRRIQSPPSP